MAAAERITFADFQKRFKAEKACREYLFISVFQKASFAPNVGEGSTIPSTAAICASANNAASRHP